MKTYGTFGYAPPREERPTAVFAVVADPYTSDRLRRIFPGTRQNTHGQFIITATPSNARDLEWFLERHPLVPNDGESSAQLSKLADQFRNNEAAIERVNNLDVGAVQFTGAHQPALTPRPYQLAVPELLRVQNGFLLGDVLGTGKTFASSLICCDDGALPAAVVVPQHLVKQWSEEELPDYYPWARIHKIRNGTPYRLDQFRGKDIEPPHFFLFTYGKLTDAWVDRLIKEDAVKTVIFDEADALRTGPLTASGGSRRYEICERLAAAAKYRIGLTGTPVHNYADEMWNVANLLQPGCLGTKDEFTRTWGGKKVENPRALGTFLRDRGIMLRRTRKDIGSELGPDPIELEQPVETDSVKLKSMIEQGIVALASRVVSGTREQKWSSSGMLEQRMRKATGIAKAPYVAEFAKMVLESENKIVLAGHHHEVEDMWLELLREYQPVMFGGRQSPAHKAEAKQSFVQGESRILVMAIRSGAGLNGLQHVCNTVIFGELDWTPPPHKQIIGRLDRPGQTTFPVMAHYMVSDDGSDPVMADVLQVKKNLAHPLVDPDAPLVEASPEEAAKRTRMLAEFVLRKHGIDPDNMPAPMPDPPAGGPLITRDSLRDRMRGGGQR